MKLSLKDVLDVPGSEKTFSDTLSLAELSFPFGSPFPEPVGVTGRVYNKAGMVLFSASLSTVAHLSCDRCAEPFLRDFSLPVETVLAESAESEENDDIFIVSGESVETDEILIPALILAVDQKNLCRDDCRGLCPFCGQNLNRAECQCSHKTADPRLEALKHWGQ